MKFKKLFLLPFALIPLGFMTSCTDSKTFFARGDEIYDYVDFNVSHQLDIKPYVCSIIVKINPKAKAGYQLNWLACAVHVDVYYFGTRDGENKSDHRDVKFYYFGKTTTVHEQTESVTPFLDTVDNVIVTLDEIVSDINVGCEASITRL